MSVAIGTGAIWPGIPPAGQSLAHAYLEQPLAPRNSVELSREMLFTLLEYLSTMIHSEFSGMPIRLVAHGGACMLLHNGLHELANRKAMHHSSRGENVARRTTTRDVDYIHRSFIAESTSRGIINPGERLQKCIQATARQFRLGADWMNSDADVALPMSTEYVFYVLMYCLLHIFHYCQVRIQVHHLTPSTPNRWRRTMYSFIRCSLLLTSCCQLSA